MKSTPYTFTITNTCSGSANYIVNLESLSNTTFNSISIRVALDETNKLYSEFEESNKYFEDSIEARTLVGGTLEDNESVTYNLRMWIDENAPATEQNKIFASKIVVTSGQEGAGIDPTIENLSATSTIDSINITYQANGDIGTTCKYGIEAGTYDNEVADATNTNCNIEGLSENTTYYYQVCTETGKGSKCVDGNIKTKFSISSVEIGDYISMTPTSTGYAIPKKLTGYSSVQVIDPSELNLWRVIRKNENGTVDMVSEYVSSTKVYFYGKEGYKNLVGVLNTIAAQYTDGKHVQSTRHIGYNNQIETCIVVSTTDCPNDTGYTTDVDLVLSALGSLVANRNGTFVTELYWLGSRRFERGAFYGRFVNTGGSTEGLIWLCDENEGGGENAVAMAVRPIVTLKSTNEKLSGSGTESSPYVLN